MDSRFEITIVLSLILAILTVVFAYRKKSKKQDPLFGNCDSFVDKVAAVVFSAFYVLPSLGITFILLVLWKLDYLLIWGINDWWLDYYSISAYNHIRFQKT